MTKSTQLENRLVTIFFFFLAVLSRIPLWFAHPGHADSGGAWSAGVKWLQTGTYIPSRRPGAPVYEISLGLWDLLFKWLDVPYHYYTNALTLLIFWFTLVVLFYSYRKFFSFQKSLAATIAFNFYPTSWVMGAATSDIVPVVCLISAAFLAFLHQKRFLACMIAVLAVGCRAQALAAVLPLWFLNAKYHIREGKLKKLVSESGLIALGLVLIFLPAFRVYGTELFSQPYHHDVVGIKKLGAFVVRTLNLFGPLGFFCFIAVFLVHRRKFFLKKNIELTYLLSTFSLLILISVAVAPWEMFYLLPLVPIGLGLFFGLVKNKPLLFLFLISSLIPSFIQIQFKPWKLPFWEAKSGVLESHLKQQWIIRGGG